MINSNYAPETMIVATRRMFADAFLRARDVSVQIRNATSEFVDESCEVGTLFVLANDKRSGFSVSPDGELRYVFSTVKGRGDTLVSHAVSLGATRLDCYDGYLPNLYGRHGFVITHREDNWTPGGPDVVWMERP